MRVAELGADGLRLRQAVRRAGLAGAAAVFLLSLGCGAPQPPPLSPGNPSPTEAALAAIAKAMTPAASTVGQEVPAGIGAHSRAPLPGLDIPATLETPHQSVSTPAGEAPSPTPATVAVSPSPKPATATPAATPTTPPTATPPASPTRSAPPPAIATLTSSPLPTANTALWRRAGSQLDEGTRQGTVIAGEELRLAQQSNGTFQASGTLISPEYEARFPFDNAVLSWNARAPAGTGLRFELRVRVGDTWTPWYVMGTWGANGGASQSGQSDNWGKVDVDTLALRQAAGAWQYRVTMTTQEATVSPALQRLALVYADLRRPLAGPVSHPATGWARDLAVPAYSQLAEDPAIARAICSPTSLTMLLNYYGLNKRVAEVAQGVRDRVTGIFGNWPLNTAYAATLGMEAYVDRFYTIAQLQDEIAQGRPAAISIKFGSGELHNSPLDSTSGHLIVVRGFTPEGNVIVNDPFGPNAAAVRRIYNRQELEKIWLRSGGVVYLVRPIS